MKSHKFERRLIINHLTSSLYYIEQYLDLFRISSVTNALMHIPTHQTIGEHLNTCFTHQVITFGRNMKLLVNETRLEVLNQKNGV